jgi:hypothetical protein
MDLAAAAAGICATRMSLPLADMGQREPAASGLNDHATTGSGLTRQSNALDLELLVFSRQGTG